MNRAGVRLYYEDAGSGPVVLLHTGGGGDGRMWELAGYTKTLTGYQTLLMDHRGHGRSDCPAGLAAHRMTEYIADVSRTPPATPCRRHKRCRTAQRRSCQGCTSCKRSGAPTSRAHH